MLYLGKTGYLYPCPFCASNHLSYVEDPDYEMTQKYVVCLTCFAQGPSFFIHKDSNIEDSPFEENIHEIAWNKRRDLLLELKISRKVEKSVSLEDNPKCA